jgi:hypothetical protein
MRPGEPGRIGYTLKALSAGLDAIPRRWRDELNGAPDYSVLVERFFSSGAKSLPR